MAAVPRELPPPVEEVEPPPPPVEVAPRPIEAARVTDVGVLVVTSDQMASASAEIPRTQRAGISACKPVLL